MARLQDKVVVVTGASSGFGRGIAKACAAEGAKVVVSDVHENPNTGGFEDDAALTTAEAIEKSGGRADLRGCDVTKARPGRQLIAGPSREYGRIDVCQQRRGLPEREAVCTNSTRPISTSATRSTRRARFFGAKRRSRRCWPRATAGSSSTWSRPRGCRAIPTSRSTTSPRGRGQPHPLPRHRVRQGRHPRQRHLPDLRQDLADPAAVRRQGLRPGLHRVHPAEAVGRGRRHRKPRGLPRLRRVHLHPWRPDQGRRRRDALPLLGLSSKPVPQSRPDRAVGPER